MKQFKFLFLFLLIGCSSSKVITDYDDAINFNDFKTYQFYEDVGKGLNEFDVKRVIAVINSELESRDFKEVEKPDFYINVISKTSEAKTNNTIGIGVGSGSRNGGFGISGGIPIGGKKLNEEFKIEFVNAKTNQIIWEGFLNSTIKEKRKPEEKELHFKEIIKQILANYPPGKKN
jgi:hypothetical protein